MKYEEIYGKWLQSKLNAAIRARNDRLSVRLYTDVAYKALLRSKEEIALILQGGNAARSAAEHVDKNVLPLSVSMLCAMEYKHILSDAVNRVQQDYNAKLLTLEAYDPTTGQTERIQTKSVFNTPFFLDEMDYHTKSETIKATMLQMSATVIYGQNAYIVPPIVSIKIDDAEYAMSHIADCNLAYMPSYDEFQATGSAYLSRNLLAHTNAFSFTLYKVLGDPLQELLEQEIASVGHPISEASALVLVIDGVEVPITKVGGIVETYANSDAAYSISLGR